jgi:hypothetical protein
MYTAMSAQLSGSLRHTHSRLVEFAEEVAFMRGEETEKMLLEREYASVMKHENHVLNRRWWFGCIEEGVIKWLWGSFGASPKLIHTVVVKLIGACSWFCVPSRCSSSYRASPPWTWVDGRKASSPIGVSSCLPQVDRES